MTHDLSNNVHACFAIKWSHKLIFLVSLKLVVCFKHFYTIEIRKQTKPEKDYLRHMRSVKHNKLEHESYHSTKSDK